MRKYLFPFFFCCFFLALSTFAFGQDIAKDKAQLQQQFENLHQVKTRKPLKPIEKYNPLYWTYRGLIGFYQKNISSQIASNCIFEITCSRFSKRLINEFGVVGGLLLSLDRLGRCNKVTLAETSPLRFDDQGKIIEHVSDYHIK